MSHQILKGLEFQDFKSLKGVNAEATITVTATIFLSENKQGNVNDFFNDLVRISEFRRKPRIVNELLNELATQMKEKYLDKPRFDDDFKETPLLARVQIGARI